ncbi:MAG: hypothetical protein NZ898_00945 [Myxococcota bacterium]|nr:hypothetical protein [Myxococcota bacterium]MDW8360839.1 hypothetical protein [Myxococcales bacterium]
MASPGGRRGRPWCGKHDDVPRAAGTRIGGHVRRAPMTEVARRQQGTVASRASGDLALQRDPS